MRIISGTLKGRKIPFVNSKFDDADVTADRVKEALFSVLCFSGNGLNGGSFLDLYGGSGQIALEAYSRGASVVINERDKRRFQFIQKLSESLSITESFFMLNFSDMVCLRYLNKRGFEFDYLYLDPPYIKKKGRVSFYGELLEGVIKAQIVKKGALIILQYYAKNELVSIPDSLELVQIKKYGATSLAYYSL